MKKEPKKKRKRCKDCRFLGPVEYPVWRNCKEGTTAMPLTGGEFACSRYEPKSK